MNISEISIKQLYNHYDYTINLGDKITIIHGPNGCGKTTILKLIDALFNNKIDYISKIDFKSIIVKFDNKTRLEATWVQFKHGDELRTGRRRIRCPFII